MSPIKAALSAAGWTVKASAALAASGSFISGTGTRGGLQTRYVMAASMVHFDYYLNFEKAYHYYISVIDAKTNEEVLTMSGDDSARRLGKKIVKALSTP